jgi:hypothetical protein
VLVLRRSALGRALEVQDVGAFRGVALGLTREPRRPQVYLLRHQATHIGKSDKVCQSITVLPAANSGEYVRILRVLFVKRCDCAQTQIGKS